MADVSFGEWLKRRRNSLGLTQEQFARQINCSTSALRKFEAELRRPSADVIEQLAKVFNIPQAEQKSFLRFARGDWQAMSDGDDTDAPWHTSPVQVEKRQEASIPRNNLSLQLTSFIGREKELVEIADLIATHRLVSLIGAGGIGKTRLSLEVAHKVLNTFPDGVWFIEFAPLADAALIPQVTINTLGLIEQANRTPQNILMDFLKEKQTLLIFDNCEHLIEALAQLAGTLLQACPNLKILATSREALNIFGETTWMASTLSLPNIHEAVLPENLSQYDAIRLFIERAAMALPSFVLNTQNNAVAIAQVCQRLDGLPLAIELAAVHVRALTVEQIAAHLNSRFHLLTSGNRNAPPRHQTLEAMIDWSYNLLSAKHQILFQRLSVFAGGWTLEAAEAVCSGEGIELSEVPALLSNLVNNSLVIAQTQGELPRYYMLETIRQYAHEKLWQATEGELMRQRHLAYFVDLAERAEPHLRAFGMIEWLDRLENELDNIRVALNYALESDIEAQLRIAGALLWFWHIRGHRHEGIDWLEKGLSIETSERGNRSLESSRSMLRGKALITSGFLINMSFDLKKAALRFEESLALFQGLGSIGKQGMAYALTYLGGLLGRVDKILGRNMLEQGLTIFRELGDKFGSAECLMLLIGYSQESDDYKQGIIFAEEQLELRKEMGDRDGIAIALRSLSFLVFLQNDYPKALTLLEESIAIFRELKNKWGISFTLPDIGDFCFWQGDYDRAAEIYQEALTLEQELGDRFFVASNIYNLGVIFQLRGEYSRATQMITESLAVFRDAGNEWYVAGGQHTLGDIALAQGKDKNAVTWYEAELAYSRERQFTLGFIFASIGLGKVAWIKSDYDLAIKRFEDVMRRFNEVGERSATFHALYGLGRVAQSQGDYATAHTNYIEMLKLQNQQMKVLFNGVGLKAYRCAAAYPLDGFGTLAILQNQLQQGTILLGAAESQYPPLRFEMSAQERAEHDQAIATARAALGEEEFMKLWEEGQKMTLDEAVAYALSDS